MGTNNTRKTKAGFSLTPFVKKQPAHSSSRAQRRLTARHPERTTHTETSHCTYA